jgi:hypothetical protein
MTQQRVNRNRRFPGVARGVWSALLLVSAAAGPAAARNPHDQLCFPKTVWYGTPAPDVTKGFVSTDPGWRGAFRYVFGNGTTSPDAIVQGIQDGASPNNLYIGVQVNNLKNWDPYSTLVLAFDPDGTDLNKELLVIQPIPPGATNGSVYGPAGVAANTFVDYYHGFDATNGWGFPATRGDGSPGHQPNPAWAQIYTDVVAGGTYQWALAAKLPVDPKGNAGIAAPPTALFGFYFDIFAFPNELPTDPPGSVPAIQGSWPPDALPIAAVGCSDPLTCVFTQPATLPAASSWGNATISPTGACQGVSVSSQVDNIFTNNTTDNLQISLTSANTFSAYVQNTMVDISGNPLQAQGISATFKIANFGLPSPYTSWAIPGSETGGSPIGGDPAGPMNIPSSGPVTTCTGAVNNSNAACILTTGNWTLNGQEQTDYKNANMGHQCILVEIDATPGSNTIILNNTAVQNMNFPEAMMMTMMERTAEINARGYPPAAGRADQLFELGVFTKAELIRPVDPARAAATGDQTAQYTWELHGCRHTGTFISIRQKRIELCQNAGAFGFVVRSAASTTGKQWEQELSGPGLSKGRNNVYSIHIPRNGVAQVRTRITPPSAAKGEGGCFHSKSGGAGVFLLLGIVFAGKLAYGRHEGKA